MDTTRDRWNGHYRKSRSVLHYPDENLVRMLSASLPDFPARSGLRALDLGCGTGRHLRLLLEMGITGPIAADYSLNALTACRELYPVPLLCAENSSIPLTAECIDVLIAWGSLHYGDKSGTAGQLGEIHRVLRPGGFCFCTLRTDRDSYLRRGREIGNNVWETSLGDLESALVSFFSEDELAPLFSAFSRFEYGLMERSRPGDTGRIISHWYIHAER